MKALRVTLLAVLVTTGLGCSPEPIANFEFSYFDDSDPAKVSFTNLSTDADTYRWEFGDGNISTDKDPVHTYTNSGTFAVSLGVRGKGGESQIIKDVSITLSTTYVVRNLSSFTLYEVMSYYQPGTEIEAYYLHGTMTPNTWSDEVMTDYTPLDLYFEQADGAMCVVVDSYPMVPGKLNYMDFDDLTYYYYEYPDKKSTSAAKSAPTPDDIQRIRETGKVGKLEDLKE